MKPYPNTKPSGVEWLGDVPAHWEVKRSDGLVSVDRFQVSPETFADTLVFHYSIPAVQEHGTGEVEEGSSIASAKQVITKPVVLVSKLNPRKATICLASPQATLTVCSTEFVALNPDKCQIRYLEYLMQSEGFRQSLDSRVQSVTRSHQRANPSDIYRFWNAWPSNSEQTAIAAYLDRETGRIDELIGKKRELIERLKEKRTALISRTVTRGLPADIPSETLARLEEIAGEKLPLNSSLKPSGIEWLGDVAEHWFRTTVKRVVSVRGRIGFRGYTTDDLVDESEGALALGGANLTKSGRLDLSKRTYLSWFKYEESPEIKVEPGDLIIGQRGTCGDVVLIDRDLGPTTINPSLVLLKQPVIQCGFLWYWLMGRFVRGIFDTYLSATAVPMLSQEQIGNVPVCHPPLPEQRAIAAYLDEETAKLDALVAKVETAIERLQEYRAALITAAVTGKIDVREETES